MIWTDLHTWAIIIAFWLGGFVVTLRLLWKTPGSKPRQWVIAAMLWPLIITSSPSF